MPRAEALERSEVVPLRSDGALRLGVVADTHSAPHPLLARHLRELKPDAILHAGDIGALSVLDELARIAPVLAVRGNIDVVAPDLPDVLTLHLGSPERSVARVVLVHIAVDGPRLRSDAARLARDRRADLVVCGHSHVPFIGRDRDVAVFNPGSAGPRRFHLPIVFGTLEVVDGGVRLAHVDCETGKRWAPPGARRA